MMFLGDFCSGKHSMDSTPTNVGAIKHIKLTNFIFDSLFVSKAIYLSWSGEILYPWDYDTLLYAKFEGDLMGGNVDFTSDMIDSIRVKRRKKGTYEYKTFFEIPINQNNDMSFARFDYFARSKQEYDYALVPCLNDVEGTINSNSILSEFEGIFLVEKDTALQAILNTKLEHQRVKNGRTIQSLGSKYPWHISNGDVNYTTGKMEATFIEKTSDCDFDLENGWKYREMVNDYITNGRPKILKDFEGKMWLISIIEDSIRERQEGHYQNIIHSFDWDEIGDAENVAHLYNNNFIDANIEGR